jgi:hypothetical protein
MNFEEERELTSEQTSISLPRWMKEWVKQTARMSGVKVSQVYQRIILDYIQTHDRAELIKIVQNLDKKMDKNSVDNRHDSAGNPIMVQRLENGLISVTNQATGQVRSFNSDQELRAWRTSDMPW